MNIQKFKLKPHRLAYESSIGESIFPTCRSKFDKSLLQGSWANSNGANSDDWANSDDFLGKSLKLIFVIIPTFS